MSLRYYLYISDTKVDMLLSQIDPRFTGRRTAEFSMNLTVLGAKRSSESAGSDRVARVERVVRHLQEHGDLGTVDEPGQFLWGLLPMQWGAHFTENGTPLVYFGGRTQHTVLGLGGSIGHVLGSASAPNDAGFSDSSGPTMLDALGKVVRYGTRRARTLVDDLGVTVADDSLDTAAGDPLPAGNRAALELVERANALLDGPTQHVEFVAKRLLHGPSTQRTAAGQGAATVLLGSPLYVALVD
ncbi:DUF7019 family protein [Actinoalloteichus fjordicus]|uniref:Uncharacterized protein n=1 Tax=Actinoalloteichus fjordicus TaxID=1612552 RepID=A0AAC9LBR7_9PSEU|nr:SAVMC3_10250 family protein [Actinoalloteichus fjordicus]APU13424.1 hypothetical protein UA74_06765 [Actinoalloteichus fjordicus]